MSAYKEAGFENRDDYLQSLADEYNVEFENVILSIFKQIKKEYNRIKSNKDLKEYYITIDNLESDVIMDKFLDELNTLSIMYDFEVDAERVKKSLK